MLSNSIDAHLNTIKRRNIPIRFGQQNYQLGNDGEIEERGDGGTQNWLIRIVLRDILQNIGKGWTQLAIAPESG